MNKQLEEYLKINPHCDLSLFLDEVKKTKTLMMHVDNNKKNFYIWPKNYNKVEIEIFYLDLKFWLDFFNYNNVHDMTLSEWGSSLIQYFPFRRKHIKEDLFTFTTLSEASNSISTDTMKSFMGFHEDIIKIDDSLYVDKNYFTDIIYDPDVFGSDEVEVMRHWVKMLLNDPEIKVIYSPY